MKKLTLTLILALLTTLCNAQTDYIKVYSVTDTVNVNDSITIKFTMHQNQTSNGMSRLQLWTSTYLQDCMYIYTLGNLTDTNSIKVKILPIMGTGNARIYSNHTVGGYKPFYIKSISQVGIKELDKSEITSIKYYDIYGKEKSLTEAKDLTIKITTYSNGYQKSDKIIILP